MRTKFKLLYWKFLNYVFDKIRSFRDDYDPNEDFLCGHCCKPFFGRYLFCSPECEVAFYAGMREDS
jgi:hypothetical protein